MQQLDTVAASPGYAAQRAPIRRLIETKQFQNALSSLIDLSGQFALDPELLDDMAICYWNLGDHETALRLLDVIVEIRPGDAAVWSKLGAMALTAGQNERAEKALLQSIRLKPKSPGALAALNRIKIFPRNGHRAKTLRKLASSKDISPQNRVTALNALGRIEEAAGNYQMAFRFFEKAKKHTPGRYDPDALDQHVSDQKHLFDGRKKADMAAQLAATPRYIFIVGMPRSGTTLVENILCRHPDVDTVGESPALQDALKQARALVAQQHGAVGSWDWYSHLTPDQISALQARYVQQTSATFPAETPKMIVDKLPLNSFEMGFANLILPQARFVFMSRHPLDVGLSNFTANFYEGQAFSKRLGWIGHLTRAAYASLEDYEGKLGTALRRQSYRALVEAPEVQIAALLDHAGLTWDSACLSPEKGGGVVRTASLTQVRAPINTKGLDKWRRYEDQLAPLIDAIGGQDWIAHWQTRDNAQQA